MVAAPVKMTELLFATQYYNLVNEQALGEDLLNLYVEALPDEARSRIIVRSTAGLDVLTTIGSGPVVLMADGQAGYIYVVSGTHAYRYANGATPSLTDLGSIGTLPVFAVGVQPYQVTLAVGALGIVVVNPPNAYYVSHTGTALAQITDPNYLGASSVCYLDGRFVFTSYDGTNRIFASGLLDATTFSALDFLYADGTPDVILLGVTYSDKIVLFGLRSIQFLYDAGVVNFPFAPVKGATMTIGTTRFASVAFCDQHLYWIGTDGVVYRNEGYRAERVSTFAVEALIRYFGLAVDIDACAYADQGHWYYCLTLRSDTLPGYVTIAYDTTTRLWHRRSSSTDGSTSWQGRSAVQTGLVSYIGDRLSGKLFLPDSVSGYEDSVAVIRQAILPPIFGGDHFVFLDRLQIDMQVGYGQVLAPLYLDYTDDYGLTWATPRSAPLTDTAARVVFTRLGRFRQRSLRLTVNDRCAFFGARADISGGAS